MKTISAVIVTFNRLDKLQTTLANTLQEPFTHVVVVDNASTDGTGKWLKTLEDPRIHVIGLKRNIGGAGGFHTGFSYVLEHLQSEWLVCFDDDAYPAKGSLEAFFEWTDRASFQSAAAAVYLPSEEICEMNRPRFFPYRKIMQIVKEGRKAMYLQNRDYGRNEAIAVDMSSFVGYFVRCDFLKKEKLLPRSELFIYADDLIFSAACSQKGARHLFLPSVRFYHDTETLVEQKAVYNPLWKVYYTFRNGIELYRTIMPWAVWPFAIAKYIDLSVKKRSYPSAKRATYQKLVDKALLDGLKQSYNTPHEEIVKL